ncbi:DALR anticodon-binding domain-containing protein 3 [Galleria mellonella]|uniref:DALR anticodon-binding domain-containing protein 3 n=1 Tax=Galleria mellonella TaxID=7137 RepID=A0A6J1WNQ6_GALME|nr:DALR anticodon-binding domain-containing protein 3 [Galleria mellonella]
MLENVLEKFYETVLAFITGAHNSVKGQLIKKHCENLSTHGDISFPNTVKSWHEYLNTTVDVDPGVTLLSFMDKQVEDLIEQSKNWVLKIRKVNESKERVYMFIERTHAIRVGLLEASRNNEFIEQSIREGTSRVLSDPVENENSITSLRVKYLTKSIQNLYCINSKCKNSFYNIIVSSKSSNACDGGRKVLCGAVLNAKTGVKETSVSGDEFIRIRQGEMTLIAQHKYGVRVSTDTKWKEFISHLGESAVVFELLQIKPNSAVKINFDCSSTGSSKGAAFILYNCARLETILRTYNDKVIEGSYPALPKYEDVDLSLLTQEDEWCLIFNYILGFPSLIANCVEINEKNCEFRPHLICNFLCSMVRVFSQYYRRVRILTEPRKHMLPVMFARIYMLKTINDTLKTCLHILNIKSVSQM